MISRTIFLFALAGCVCGATWRAVLQQKPLNLLHKNGCYVPELNDVIQFGESVTPMGVCYTIDCTRRSLYYSSCGVVGTSDAGCYVTEENYSRPYPDCCSTVKCIDDNQL